MSLKIYSKTFYTLTILFFTSKIGFSQISNTSLDSIKSQIIDTIQINKGVYEFEANKFTFNVSQFSASKGKDLGSLLRITPGLEINAGGNLSLFGVQQALLLINDKPVDLRGKDLEMYIKSIPSESISKIEVIPNPSFNQSVNPQPIVKIYLKRRPGDGYDISLNSSLNLRNSISERFSIFSNIKYGELTITPIISVNDERLVTKKQSKYFENVIQEQLNTKTKENTLAGSFVLHSDYNISKKSNISGLISVSSVKDNSVMNGYGYDTQDLDINRYYRNTPINFKSGIAYKQEFKTSNLLFDVYFSRRQNDPIDSLLNFERLDYFSNAKFNVRNLNSSLNYTIPLSERIELSLGSKIESNKNDVDNIIYSDDVSLETGLKYSERIWHNHFTLNLPVSKTINLSLGGKVESSNILLESKSIDNQNYTNFLPNINAIKKAGKGQIMLAYSRQLSRPSYSQLNPTVNILSKNMLSKGNPNLTPEIWNMFSINYMPKRGLIIFGRLLSNSNLIVYDQNQDNEDERFYLSPRNISERQNSYIAGFTLKNKISILNYSLTNNFLLADNPPVFNSNNSFIYKVVLTSDVSNVFNSGIDLFFYGTYRNSQININEEKNSYVRYHFDFTKNFKKDLTIGFTVENPIIIFKNKTLFNYSGNAYRYEEYTPDIRTFKIYFSKKFGKTKIKGAKKIEMDEERLNMKDDN